MPDRMKSYLWFLGFLVVTNVIVAPLIRKVTPKDAAGVPLLNLL